MNKPKDFLSIFTKKMNKQEARPFDFEDPWLMARDWYASELGQILLRSEKQSLEPLLEQIFGYNLVQLGCLDNVSVDGVHVDKDFNHTEDKIRHNNAIGLTAHSRTSFQFIFESLSQANQANSETQLLSDFEQLPLKNHSVDVLLLPHTLEFEKNPHQILREVERVLVAEGKAVFLGFNPFSLWGLWHKYWELKKHIAVNSRDKNAINCQVPLPSCGHLISQRRLRDWLKLLGFDITLVNEYFYRPPIRSTVLLDKLEFMEMAGQFSKILPAGGYLLVATKRVSTLTPIREGWKFTNGLITPKAVETADMKSNNHSDLQTNHKIYNKEPYGQK